MTPQDLADDLKSYARSQGAQLVGIAGVERFVGAPKGHWPEDFLPGARSVVVLGLPVLSAYASYPEFMKGSEKVPESINQRRPNPEGAPLDTEKTTVTYRTRYAIANHVYRRCAYEFLNMELQRLSLYAALYLENHGHPSIYMPTAYGSTFTWNMRAPRPNFMGPFSHRHAAVAAGLGRFGLNNLVLTPQYGPLQRFVSVITTAELTSDPLMEEDVCLGEKCSVCREQCPNECFANELEEYDCGGAAVRVWKMDKGRCGKYDDAKRRCCQRECWFKCPLALRGTAATPRSA